MLLSKIWERQALKIHVPVISLGAQIILDKLLQIQLSWSQKWLAIQSVDSLIVLHGEVDVKATPAILELHVFQAYICMKLNHNIQTFGEALSPAALILM